MELEEAITMVEYIKNETKLACEFPKATERDKNRWGKEVQALEVVLHYIKEESVPKAVVEEKIEKLKILAEKSDDETLTACELDIRKNQIYLLQSILNKGESDEN